MGDVQLKASKSWGGDYDCQQAWPENTYLQCGDSGLVVGKGKKDSYITAFFEAFPKDPSTFIRGEGKDLEEAELNAFNKYLKIKACDKHDYTRHGTSEHANCLKCGLFTSHHFKPLQTCSCCGKEGVNYFTGDSDLNITYWCMEHFFEKVRTFLKDYDIDNIPEYTGMSDVYEMNKHYIREMYFTELSIKYGLVDINEDEYKINTDLDKKRHNFDHHCRVRINKLHFALNDLLPEGEKFVITGLMFPKIYQHLFLAPDLYEELFKEFYEIKSDKDIRNDLIEFHAKLYERYRKK